MMRHAICFVAWVGGSTLAGGCDSDADRVKTSDKQQVAEADRVKTSDKQHLAVALVEKRDKAKTADKAAQGLMPGSAADAGGDMVAVADRKLAPTDHSAAARSSDTPTLHVAGGEGHGIAAAVAVPDAQAKPTDAAGTLAQKEGWANYTRDVQAKIAQVNGTCGTRLTASYDRSTYTDFDPIKDRTEAACKQAVGTLQAICASAEGKTSVQKLSKTVCKFSTSGTGASVTSTTLVIKIDPEKSSITGKAAGSYIWASAIKEVL